MFVSLVHTTVKKLKKLGLPTGSTGSSESGCELMLLSYWRSKTFTPAAPAIHSQCPWRSNLYSSKSVLSFHGAATFTPANPLSVSILIFDRTEAFGS